MEQLITLALSIIRGAFGRSGVLKGLLLAIVIAQAALAGCGAMGTSEEGASEKSTSPSTTPPSKVSATPIVGATLGEFKAENEDIKAESMPSSADIALVKLVFEPGGSTGWHHHPGVLLIPVEAGAVTEYDAQCHKTVYKAGKAFAESNGEVHLVRNEGDVKAVLYPTFLVPTGTPPEKLTISDPQPKDCNVS
jgi:quercetin dioxygenase-like cupin family protein